MGGSGGPYERAVGIARLSASDAPAEIGLRLILDTAPALIWTASASGKTELLNRYFQDYVRLPPEEIEARGWTGAIHPEDVPSIAAVWREIRASRQPGQTEVRLRRHDGVYRWFLVRANPLKDTRGAIVRWCGVNTDIEDRKSAELALAIGERSLKDAIDRFPANLSFVTGPGANVSLNRHFWDFTGLTPDPAKPVAWLDAYHPEDRDDMFAKLSDFRIAGEGGTVEGRLRRHDGVYRWFQLRTRPFRDESGQIIRWYTVGIDIDDRKRTEQALIESERSLNDAIDLFPATLWFTDPEGNQEKMNQHFWDFTGLTPDEADPTAWYAAFHPDELAGIGKKFRDLQRGGKPGDIEARIRRFDGVYRWFLLRSFPSYDATGNIVRWYGVGADIDDRRKAEAELQRAYRDLNEAQKLSRTGSYTNDYIAGEHIWSDELYRMFEFEFGTKVTSEAALAAVHPEDRGFFSAAFERAAADGSDVDITYRIVTASGRTKHLHTISHTLGFDEGRPVHVGAVQDITDRRLAEEARDKARSELTHASRAMSLGMLTASIAHEVNQPLSGIITNANTSLRILSAETPNLEGARETARRTIRDAKRAAEVIARLRTLFSRKDFAAETIDLADAAREVIALSAQELQRHSITLKTAFAEGLAPITGDRVQLQQVILNLILNAADAVRVIEERPRRITVLIHGDEPNALRLAVRDTGIGIAPEALARLFDPFFTTKPNGMGIGLSVSRSIIERHGGRLWAEQNDGPGATFLFSIPCADLRDDGPHRPDLESTQ